MRTAGLYTSGLIFLAWAAAAPAADQPAPKAAAATPQAAEFFETKVRPVLATYCTSCHGPSHQRGGLRLDSRAAFTKGGDDGPVMVPGDPAHSALIQAVRREGDVKMPPKEKLPDDAIAALTAWVRMGAPWPEEAATAPVTHDDASVAAARTTHWAFRPVRAPALPAVKDPAWAQNPIDRFVLSRLEEKGLAPAPPADRRTLIRRVSFDLTGLPPTPEEVDAFVNDPSADAYEKLVDRLLASPHYGERWGRYWLDVARYADTKGYFFESERRYPFAYTYRDYVIRSFNEDLPYDRFITEQLAADKVELGADKRPLAAMGFLTLGRRFLGNVHDIIDDRIDVVSRGLLGLTVACARCHDHKFDPIPQKDYYSLYGVFASSVEPNVLPAIGDPDPTPEYLAFQKALAPLQADVTRYEDEHRDELRAGNRKFRDGLRALQKKVDELRVTHPGSPPQAMVLADAPTPTTPHVLLRGNPNNVGEAVPRQFLLVLAGPNRQPFKEGSGRLELARAIASRDNPLTARVLVNRVWLHHFGQGLVRTPSNFGLRGEPPTHPELLDYLAGTFMDQGWSIKKLHRLILLSRTYRQAADGDPRGEGMDPENRLLGRMNRRRLDFEALRDSLLTAAGRLDPRVGGRSVDLVQAPYTTRRSVYGFIDRQNLPGLFRAFDFASPDSSSPQRYETTVPQQALFLMNSPFVVEQARRLAARADVVAHEDGPGRIEYLYRLLFGRAADPEEVTLGLQFLETARHEEGQGQARGKGLSAWEKYAQVLLASDEFAFVD
jgi:cytochrome c553